MKDVKNAFGALIFGLILFVASFVVLWLNEGNSAKNIATASYMNKKATQIEPTKIQDSNNGSLVAATGAAIADSTLYDVNIKIPKALVLERTVEMYQLDEEKDDDSNGNTTYKYTKKWSDSKIDSDSFHDKNYRNPNFPIESMDFYADSAKLGAFDLTPDQIKRIIPEKEITDLPQNQKYSIENGKYFSGKDIQEPNIGDVLISYSYAPSGTNISFIGKQESNHIMPFSYQKRSNYVQYNGSLDKEAIIEKYKHENHVLTMALRFVGWLLMFFGLKLLTSPLELLFGFIPIFGKIASNISTFVAMLISLVLSLITIAIAWFAYRPIVSIILIVVSVGIVWVIKQKLPKKVEEN